MQEGWYGEDYLVLFDASEAPDASLRYDVSRFLPGYEVLGLRLGRPDVRDENACLTVPSVPLVPSYLEPFQLPQSHTHFQHDARFTGRIKWYVQPLVFGGTSSVEKNLIWVDHDLHSRLVRWWNDKYRELASRKRET